MKQVKYRLNTLLDHDIAMGLKAYADFKGFTLAEAIENLLRKPLVHMIKAKKGHIELDLKKMYTVQQEALKEYREGKTILISTKKDLAKHFKEIDKAVDS